MPSRKRQFTPHLQNLYLRILQFSIDFAKDNGREATIVEITAGMGTYSVDHIRWVISMGRRNSLLHNYPNFVTDRYARPKPTYCAELKEPPLVRKTSAWNIVRGATIWTQIDISRQASIRALESRRADKKSIKSIDLDFQQIMAKVNLLLGESD